MSFEKAREILSIFINTGEYSDLQDFRHAVLMAFMLIEATASIECATGKYLQEYLKLEEQL